LAPTGFLAELVFEGPSKYRYFLEPRWGIDIRTLES
jgi:hypothetical protein